MIRNILMMTFLIIIWTGISIRFDDYARIDYNNSSFPIREKLLYDKKYKAIENGDLFVEDMWYLMMMNASKTNQIIKQNDYLKFSDSDLEPDVTENIMDEIRVDIKDVYGCSYKKTFGCKIIIGNENFQKRLVLYKGKIIFLHKNDGKIIKTAYGEKEKEIADTITKETNILFRKYINSTYGCEYQVDCKNLKEENE